MVQRGVSMQERIRRAKQVLASGVGFISVPSQEGLSPEVGKRLLKMAIGNVEPADIEYYIVEATNELLRPELLVEELVDERTRERVKQSVREDLEPLTPVERDRKIQLWAYEKGQKIGLIRS